MEDLVEDGFHDVRVGDAMVVFDGGCMLEANVERVTRYYVLVGGLWFRRDNGYRRGRDHTRSRGR